MRNRYGFPGIINERYRMKRLTSVKALFLSGCVATVIMAAMITGAAGPGWGIDVRPESSAGHDYPRLTYRMLLNDGEFLKGEKFTGVIYPREIMKSVPAVRRITGPGMRMVKAVTTGRKYALYVVIPEGSVPRISSLIGKNKPFPLVYSPVGLYAGLPVIKLIRDPGAEDEKSVAKDYFSTGIASYYPGNPGAKWTIAIGKNVRLLEYEITEARPGISIGLRQESVPGRPDLDKRTPFMIEYTKNSVMVSMETRDETGQAAMKGDILIKGPIVSGTRWVSVVDGIERRREITSTDAAVTTDTAEYRSVMVVKEESSVKTGDGVQYIAVTYYFYAPGVGFLGCKIDSAETPEGIRPYEEISDWFMQRVD